MRIATGAERPRNDMFFCRESVQVRADRGVRPYTLPRTDLWEMNHRLPRKNPSTRVRLVPLPLGKGGNGLPGVRWGGRPRGSPLRRVARGAEGGPMWASAPTGFIVGFGEIFFMGMDYYCF